MHEIIVEKLEDYLSGRGGREVGSHLSGCESCRAEVAELAAVSEYLSELRTSEPVSVPLGFSNRVMMGIRDQKPKGFWSIFAMNPAFTRKLALASLLCLAACGVYLATQPIDAAAQADHTPEAVLASHDATAPSSDPQHMDGMLVTLASYNQ